MKKSILDAYYQYIEEHYCTRTLDEVLGKTYFIEKNLSIGNFFRIIIENGLELSRIDAEEIDFEFDNREFEDDILEVGYCYQGETEIVTFPENKEYRLQKNNIFIYRSFNKIDYFQFQYNHCKTMSVHLNFNNIRNAMNPIWENQLILEWEKNLDHIFKGNILIIQEASYGLKNIAKEIDSLSVNNMMGYIQLKLKVIEFLSRFFEEKNNVGIIRKYKIDEVEKVRRAAEIIKYKLEDPPSVSELAELVNVSVYKLQNSFKVQTGCTVYQYIRRLKLERAKFLLLNTKMSVLEISNEVGYENPSKFASLFKQYNNMTPFIYRKHMKRR